MGLGVEALFDMDQAPERDAFLRRVNALVAPVAANGGVVIEHVPRCSFPVRFRRHAPCYP